MKRLEKVGSLALLLAVVAFKAWVGTETSSLSEKALAQKASDLSQTPSGLVQSEAKMNKAEEMPGAQASLKEEKQVPDSFSASLEQAWTSLPTTEKLRSLSHEEAHDTPELIFQGGRAIGAIAEDVAKNPMLKTKAAAFYQRCAEASPVAVSIRALCLSQLRELKSRYGWSGSIETSHLSSEVLRLADLI